MFQVWILCKNFVDINFCGCWILCTSFCVKNGQYKILDFLQCSEATIYINKYTYSQILRCKGHVKERKLDNGKECLELYFITWLKPYVCVIIEYYEQGKFHGNQVVFNFHGSKCSWKANFHGLFTKISTHKSYYPYGIQCSTFRTIILM